MNQLVNWRLTLALAAAASMPFAALAASAIPTFESLGLYWTPPANPGPAGCQVRYRSTGAAQWQEGFGLWYDPRNGECRGSLVHLAPGTEYEIELAMPGAPAEQLTARTWAENFPIATTVQVQSGSGTLKITQGGTPAGYVLYTGPATLDAANAVDYNVEISAPYVIVRGLTLKGARADAIRLLPGAHDVVIEDNDISGWGRFRKQIAPGWAGGVEGDSAIRARCNATPWLERLVVQRNRLHHPRYGANSWDFGHPQGPHAIRLERCGGNHVIRYNEIESSENRYFHDAIGGADNYSAAGFPNADSDIYGNRISHVWDDAIEAEGGNRNVRIWGNYTDQTAAAVATTPTHVGPVYIFRNVMNRSRMLSRVAPDNDLDLGRVFAKSGSLSGFGGGRRYVFHNTLLQAPPPAGSSYESGAGFALGSSAYQPLSNTVSRNNLFHIRKSWRAAIDDGHGADATNDLDYDVVNGNVLAYAGAEANGIVGTPVFQPGHGWSSESGGLYQLAPHSPGYDGGARLPSFNDGFTGAAPDMGAHEAGTPPLRFGAAAARTILWSAGMETGNLSEFELETHSDADSRAVLAAAEGIAARSGSWVMKQSVLGTSGATRMYRNSTIDNVYRTGNPIYYSFWAYFPHAFRSDFFNLLQVQSANPQHQLDPVWILGVHPTDFTLRLEWWAGLQMDGPHIGESAGRAYDQPVPIPTGQWVFIQFMVQPREDFTGAVRVWMNRALIFDLANVRTKYPESLVPAGVQSFAISKNAYGMNLTPAPNHHYVDDLTISLDPLPY